MSVPNPLVLKMTTVAGKGGCPSIITTQLQRGNTFNVAFDTSEVPPKPGGGVAFLDTAPQKNFTADTRVQLSNEGIAGEFAFFSISSTQAQIYGETFTVDGVSLTGKPNSSGGYTWFTGLEIGECVITNGAGEIEDQS